MSKNTSKNTSKAKNEATAKVVAVNYTHAKRWDTISKDGKKTTHHEGAAILTITTEDGVKRIAADYYAQVDQRAELLPYCSTFDKLAVKVARVELAAVLGVELSKEAYEAAEEADAMIEERTAKRNAREVATVEAGKDAYTERASKAAGARFDKLAKKWANTSARVHAKRNA